MQQTGAGKGDSIAAVIVSCCAAGAVPNGQPRVFSRFFAPWLGVEEDPVTGSAHSVLVPYYRSPDNRSIRAVNGTTTPGILSLLGQCVVSVPDVRVIGARYPLLLCSDVLGDGAIQFRQCSQRTGDLHGVLESKVMGEQTL